MPAWDKILKAITSPAAAKTVGGVTTATGLDLLNHPDKVDTFGVDTVSQLFTGEMEAPRVANLLMNTAIGVTGGGIIHGGARSYRAAGSIADDVARASTREKAFGQVENGIKTVMLAPAKDLVLNTVPLPGAIIDHLHDVSAGDAARMEAAQAATQAATHAQESADTSNIILGAIGAGVLGLGGLAVYKYLNSKDPKADVGKLKIKLPGSRKDPSTATVVEVPLDAPEMSPALLDDIDSIVRRQTRKNIRANSFKRDPETGKLIPYDEWKEKQKAMEQHSEYGQPMLPHSGMPKAASDEGGMSLRTRGVLIGSGLGMLGGGALGTLVARLSGLSAGDVSLASLFGSGLGAVAGGYAYRDLLTDVAERAAANTSQGALANSCANTGTMPQGYAAIPQQVVAKVVAPSPAYSGELELDDEDDDLDKHASAGPPPGPPIGEQTTRPLGETPPPDPGIWRANTEPGASSPGSVDNLRLKLKAIDTKLKALTAVQNRPCKTASVEYYPAYILQEKSASDMSGRIEVMGIMDRIYKENPSYWPYGLGIDGHDGVYLVRDKMTKQAAGFVGWQKTRENGRLIGSYSIGILPEFRDQGFAKEAVARILRERAAEVDEVRAYVMAHNHTSKRLASSLGVPVQENF